MISKKYSKMALIALTTASLAFAGCGAKNADSDLAKPGQEVYYQSDDGTFHKVKAGQAQSGEQTLYLKGAKGKFHKKDGAAKATSKTSAHDEMSSQVDDSSVASEQATAAVVNLVAKPSEDSVAFLFNSAEIDVFGREILHDYANWLNSNSDVSITVEGNCDERGSREYNLALGEERAKSIRDVLVEYGVAASRVDTVSFGEERPVCKGAGEACWVENRRGDIVNR